MGGAGGDVKNAVWMRALVMAGMILGLSIAAYVTLGVVAADMKHQTWTDEKADYTEAKNAYDEAVDADASVENNPSSSIFVDYGNAYNDKVDAHLSYLTYRVAGLAILFVGIIFTAFLAISGLLNSSRPDEDHDDITVMMSTNIMVRRHRSSSRSDVCFSFSDSQNSLMDCMD